VATPSVKWFGQGQGEIVNPGANAEVIFLEILLLGIEIAETACIRTIVGSMSRWRQIHRKLLSSSHVERIHATARRWA